MFTMWNHHGGQPAREDRKASAGWNKPHRESAQAPEGEVPTGLPTWTHPVQEGATPRVD
jgi:hypothetical protein